MRIGSADNKIIYESKYEQKMKKEIPFQIGYPTLGKAAITIIFSL